MPFFSLEDDAPARRLLYTMAVLMVLMPVLTAGQALWPLQLWNIRWRFDAASALSSILLLPFLGLSLMVLISRVTEDKNVPRVVGAISAILVIGLLGSLVLFALDALQLRTVVPTAQEQTFQKISIRVVVSTILFTVGFSLLMITAFKSSRTAAAILRKGAKAEANSGLIVGQ
jgi:hypothetical protein